jgi:hypothetical protein
MRLPSGLTGQNSNRKEIPFKKPDFLIEILIEIFDQFSPLFASGAGPCYSFAFPPLR